MVENFGGSTHPDILVEKTLADGDNKSLLLVYTELLDAWLHGDDVYLNFSVELMICGYNEYKVVWDNPLVGEDLSKHEVGNPHDTQAV